VLATIAWLTLSSTATAFVDAGGGTHDGGQTVVDVKVGLPGSPGSGHAGDDSARPLITWTVVHIADPLGSADGLCRAPGDTPALPVLGWYYLFIGTDASGKVVGNQHVCVPFPSPGVPPPAPTPPATPTFGEAWNATTIPAPKVLLDPQTRGITGLETRISTDGPVTVVIAATVRGYTITGTATLDHYTIAVDDQPATDASTGHYTFETKGNHTIAISAIWHGIATVTGPAGTSVLPDIDLGTATITATRTYAVHEIRSVLQP
jgi:hypothetical protein